MKTILTTGSNGLLGQKLTERLLQSNPFKLIATAKGANRYPVKTGYQYAALDITNPAEMQAVLWQYKPDIIIHTAAITQVDVCQSEPENCHEVNVLAVKNLASLCKANHIHLIYLSTDFVFDGKHGPYQEEDATNPLSVYGQSKKQAEEILQQSGAAFSIVRTILVYGLTADMSRSNIVLWAKNALEKNTPIRVVNDQWRMPTLAEDLAEACLLIAERKAEGIFHISGKDYMSIAEIVRKVADYWGLNQDLIIEVSSAQLDEKAKRPLKTGFILSKAIQLLAYQPHSFDEGLQLLAKQLQNQASV